MKSLLTAPLIGTACALVAGCGCGQSDGTVPMMPVYSVEGHAITLEDGVYESGNGTVSLLVSTSGDLDGDATVDHAAILVHDSRGSGVFYYLNVLLNDGKGRFALAGEVFLGDRIRIDYMDIYKPGSVSRLTGAPISPEGYGQLVVGYYIHSPVQAYAESPGIYAMRHWKIEDNKLVSGDDNQAD
ncbi:MAG: hypothetical protein WBM45_15475 [Woeseiaceae bacterium]|jgi:hypothetical protein